jgi:hypothetical protein
MTSSRQNGIVKQGQVEKIGVNKLVVKLASG